MTEFADLDISLDTDPTPKTTGTGKRRGRPAGSGGNSRKATAEKKVADELGMYIMLGAAPFQLRDPVCAGAVVAQSKELGDALAGIVIDSPAAMKFLSAGGGMVKYFKLMLALKPIADTVREHHFGGQYADNAGYPAGAVEQGAA